MNIPDIVENARRLAPALRERAEETERLRRLPDETVKDFHQAGFFKALQPAAFGGYELPVSIFYRAVIEVSRGCGSSGWVLAVLGIHNWLLALFEEQTQQEVWAADPGVLTATSLMAAGKAVPAQGGFRLSGRWAFSSGCDHSAWMILGAIVPTDGDDEPADFRIFLVPQGDFEIVDTWHTSALSGTGSNDIVVKDIFVPAHRVLSILDISRGTLPGLRVNTAATYRLPFIPVFFDAIAVCAIGIALGALDAYRERTKKRVLALSRKKQLDQMSAQMRLAEASGEIDCARLLMERDFTELEEMVAAGETPTLEQRARYRFDAAYLVVLCKRAVERLMAASGGHALYSSNVIQRAYRDLSGVSAHVALNPDEASTIYGRVQLGLPPNDLLI